MIQIFEPVTKGIASLVEIWENKLLGLSNEVITERRNNQDRTIKQILGHLIDSASNNTHRIIHLQYQECPMEFPNYATNGNNDRWIAIQNYHEENWKDLIQYWKSINLHLVHIIENINPGKLGNEWIASPGDIVSLERMVLSYLEHFRLHLNEIDELINKG